MTLAEQILEESQNAEEAQKRLVEEAGVPEAVAWQMADVAFGGSGDTVEEP